MTLKQARKLKNYYIWNYNHIENYLENKSGKGNVWLLRTYKLKKPHMTVPRGGLSYAKLKNGINIADSQPVLDNETFTMISEDLEKKLI